MGRFDLTSFGSEPKRFCGNADMARGLAQVEPRLIAVGRCSEHWNLVVRPERSDAFARPAIAVAGHQTVPVEDAGDQIVIGDSDELSHGGEDIG